VNVISELHCEALSTAGKATPLRIYWGGFSSEVLTL